MTEQTITKTWWQREGKVLAWFIGAVLLIGGVFLIVNSAMENQRANELTTSYFCTMDGNQADPRCQD